MVLPPTSGDFFALQRRWGGTAYCDEERFKSLDAAMAAFLAAIRRTPKHDWRIRHLQTIAERRAGEALYLADNLHPPVDQPPEISEFLQTHERSN